VNTSPGRRPAPRVKLKYMSCKGWSSPDRRRKQTPVKVIMDAVRLVKETYRVKKSREISP